MAVRCPRCSNVFSPIPGQATRCPKCGYGSSAPGSRPPNAYSGSGGFAGPPTMTAPYGGQMQGRKNSGLAMSGMVVGIVSVVLCWLTIFDIPVAVTGLVLSIIGRVQIGKRPGQLTGKGLALAGIITSILGLIAIVVVFVAVTNYCNSHPLEPACKP